MRAWLTLAVARQSPFGGLTSSSDTVVEQEFASRKYLGIHSLYFTYSQRPMIVACGYFLIKSALNVCDPIF